MFAPSRDVKYRTTIFLALRSDRRCVMEIGKPRKIHRVEPLKLPVPARTSPGPEETPTAPTKVRAK
jgi:hypothetical protein